MAEFLTRRKAASYIEEIISHAKERLILISPFIQIPEDLFGRLKEAARKGIKITVVYGKEEELKPDVKNQLAELSYIEVFFLRDLHAKCYYNDEKMVVTSMNLYDFSEKNNYEMGILLTIGEDEILFKAAKEEANNIIRQAEKVKIKDTLFDKVAKDLYSVADSMGLTTPDGHCIRCNKLIKYDDKSPLCDTCYTEWAKHRNPNYKEKVCHKCGKSAAVTKARPLCRSCFKAEG